MNDKRLTGILEFLQAAEQLKDTIRSGSTRKGRPESTAEHSWRLALLVLLLERDLRGVDFPKLLKLCLVHDLGEAISGDIPAPDQKPGDDRQERERRDFQTLCAPLPRDLAESLTALWDEYAQAQTVEARFAKALDKTETILQHQLMPPPSVGFFYEFNLTYGREHTDYHPLTRQIRQQADEGTLALIRSLESKPA
ncbi:HD domain-containing protein [Roseibium salinum]|nr:HD domain-containing protein [Roseibium salinum]